MIELDGFETRKKLTLTKDNKTEKIPLYLGHETLKGKIKVVAQKKKKLEILHNGVKVFLIGQIGEKKNFKKKEQTKIFTKKNTKKSKIYEKEMFYDRGNQYEFVSVERELASAGEIKSDVEYDFEFADVEKQYESYNGINVRLR